MHPDPTPPLDASSFWHSWADRLRTHPNTPRRVWTYETPNAARTKAYQIRHGKPSAFAGGGFDARSRGRELWVVHGRFGDVPVPALDVSSPGWVALLLCLARLAGTETHPSTTENDDEENR